MTHKRGFTLVEMLISMGIMTILITILSQVFGSTLTLRQKNEAVSAVAQDSRYLVSRLSYDVARSSSISSPAVGNSASSMTLVIGGQNYVYSLSSGTLYLSIAGGSNIALNSVGTTISSLSFTRNSTIGGKSNVLLNFNILPTSKETGVSTMARNVVTTLVTW